MQSKPETLSKEDLLLDFVDTAGVGLHWVGADGTILWANRADYEPLGYSAEEYIGRNIVDFHADGDVIADILAKLKAGVRLRDYEARLRGKDGSVRCVLINSSVLFDEAGRFVHTRCFTHDITDRKRIDEAREQFVSILGHDLRNPLSAITVAAQYLLNAGDLPEKHLRPAARIARSADRMSRMIADLLDFARGRMGQGIPVQRRRTDMAPICRQVVDELQVVNPDRTVALKIAGNTEGCWDPDRIGQVISNLVGNALEHGSGAVSVTLRGDDEVVIFATKNEGAPIPPAILATIFQPFARREPGRAMRGGLGLGLFIANAIVQAHGGLIEARSTEAEGTIFAVRWPRD